MRAMLVFLAGALAGALLMLTGVMVSGGWYEYRILDAGDDVIGRVNQQGWELMPRAFNDPVYQLRRPRFRVRF
jgi:hypothetical protein